MNDRKNPHARELSRLGAAKGGRTRALRLSVEDKSAIGREGAAARWGNAMPRATHSGELVIGGRKLACANLENGKRVLSQATMLTALGRDRRPKGGTGVVGSLTGLPSFLAAENLQPFISDEVREATTPVVYRTVGGTKAQGFDALLLPMVCEVYLKADDAGKVLKSQKAVLDACKILIRGLARVGIVALVDAATGYEEQRAKDELAKILEHYIAAELMPWVKMFPDEFFRQIYRLQGWAYKPGSAKRTPQVGKLINQYIYDQLPPGVKEELCRRNPVLESGYRRYKHHQFLTPDTGHPHLDKQISVVMTLMRIAADKEEFVQLFGKAFGKPTQIRLPLVIDVTEQSHASEPR